MTILTKEEYLSLVEILAFEYGYLNLKEVMQDTKASAIPYQKLLELINEHFDNTPDFKGFKLHSDSTLMTFKKKELVDYIHMVYHHWQGTDSACNHGMKYAEKLQKINDELQRVVDELNSKETRSNPPLELEDLNPGMWVWDNYYKNYVRVTEVLTLRDFAFIVRIGFLTPSLDVTIMSVCYEESRFYRYQVKENENAN